MRTRAGVAAVVLLLVLAGGGSAQESSSCTLLDNPTRTVNISNRGTPFETWFITEAVFVCEGGRRIVAETATYAAGTGQITLNGAVRVDDPERTLTADFAQYFTETEQVHARGRVVLRQ
jgi:lipopolysaccharide assembly outer membrane protein LptD (OstA)